MASRILIAGIAGLSIACASRTIESGTDPVPGRTVEFWKVDLTDNSNASVLYARNDGSQPVTITELRLYSCVNLRQECGTHQPNVQIAPGQTAEVARLNPSNHSRRPRFGWELYWRGVRQERDATANIVSVRSAGTDMSTRTIDVEQFVPLVAPEDANGRCESPPSRNLPPGYRAYSMHFGRPGAIPIRTVTVQVDQLGTPIQFSDSRGDLRVPPPGVAPIQKVNNPGARTAITLQLLHGIAILINQPVDAPAEQFSATGPDLLNARSLGTPSLLIARMIRDCGTTR
jgi:hypothetical protein